MNTESLWIARSTNWEGCINKTRPTADEKASVVALANDVGQNLSSRAGAPVLSCDPSRDEMIAWLEWCDPNGVWSDAAATAEGWPRMTAPEAYDQLWMILYGDWT